MKNYRRNQKKKNNFLQTTPKNEPRQAREWNLQKLKMVSICIKGAEKDIEEFQITQKNCMKKGSPLRNKLQKSDDFQE